MKAEPAMTAPPFRPTPALAGWETCGLLRSDITFRDESWVRLVTIKGQLPGFRCSEAHPTAFSNPVGMRCARSLEFLCDCRYADAFLRRVNSE